MSSFIFWSVFGRNSIIGWMFASCPPLQIHVEVLTCWDGVGRGGLWKVIRVRRGPEGLGPPMINDLVRGEWNSFATREHRVWMWLSAAQKPRRPSPPPNHASTLISNFPCPELSRVNVCFWHFVYFVIAAELRQVARRNLNLPRGGRAPCIQCCFILCSVVYLGSSPEPQDTPWLTLTLRLWHSGRWKWQR